MSHDPTHLSEHANDIKVFVYAEGTEQRLGALERLTIEGATVRLGGGDPLVLPVGGPATLRFYETRSGARLTMSCRVTGRWDDAEERTYTLAFTDPHRIRALLRPVLARLFSRRQAFRATPRPGQPIEVTIEPPQEAFVSLIRVPLLDISTSGLALRVPVDFEEEMANFDQLELLFMLPNHPLPLALRGKIVNRFRDGDAIRYGLAFSDDSTRFDEQLNHVIDFVMARQREDLDEWDPATDPGAGPRR